MLAHRTLHREHLRLQCETGAVSQRSHQSASRWLCISHLIETANNVGTIAHDERNCGVLVQKSRACVHRRRWQADRRGAGTLTFSVTPTTTAPRRRHRNRWEWSLSPLVQRQLRIQLPRNRPRGSEPRAEAVFPQGVGDHQAEEASVGPQEVRPMAARVVHQEA